MTSRFPTVRISIAPLAVAALCALFSCQPPAATNDATAAPSAPQTATRATATPTRDLTQDEAAGGHIIRKHVGQTEQQLRQRLQRERNITGASTYTDLPTAERAVGAAIAQSQREIQNWLNRQGRHPNLVLDYDSPDPIGRTMNRGENQSRVCAHTIVVLKYGGPNHYYVLTSYPECR
jgi:filamentous hemagglutinin